MDEVSLDVSGLGELEAKLIDLGRNGGRRSLSKGLRAGSSVVVAEARLRVRKKSGKTAKSIRVKNQGLKFEDLTFSVIASRAAVFLERGTSKNPAYPFLRPAMENKATEAVNVMRDVALDAIEIEALTK
jgi:HK97 gp10 family phage protein